MNVRTPYRPGTEPRTRNQREEVHPDERACQRCQLQAVLTPVVGAGQICPICIYELSGKRDIPETFYHAPVEGSVALEAGYNGLKRLIQGRGTLSFR